MKTTKVPRIKTEKQQRGNPARRGEASTGWLMASPAIILILGFLIIPFLMAFGLSFTNQRLISPNPTEFVGLRNFKRLLTVRVLQIDPIVSDSGTPVLDEEGNLTYPKVRSFTRDNPDYPQYKGLQEWQTWIWGETKWVLLAGDAVFLRSLLNTFYFAIAVVPLQGGLALLLAVLINERLPGINIFRTIYFMPVVVSMVVVSILWRFIYDANNGLLNSLLSLVSFGSIKPIDWLGNPATAMPAVIIMSIWQGIGFHMVIWLAGLQNIPAPLYEVADVAGATSWQKFRYVTWPGLHDTAVFVLITITTQAFALFTQIDVMTRGGPLNATTTVVFQAVQKGYRQQDIAYGSTISVVFFIMVLIVSLIQRRLTREEKIS